jgi:5'-3' exonuclease
VQVDRRSGTVARRGRRAREVRRPPASIPDWLALVGDSADGYPGLPAWGAKSAAAVLAHFGRIEDVPANVRAWPAGIRSALALSARWSRSATRRRCSKVLATLRTEAPVSADVDAMRWRGPRPEFAGRAESLGAPGLAKRVEAIAARER